MVAKRHAQWQFGGERPGFVRARDHVLRCNAPDRVHRTGGVDEVIRRRGIGGR